MKIPNEEDSEKMHKLLIKRMDSLESVCIPEQCRQEWESLIRDEASMMHFLRLVAAVSARAATSVNSKLPVPHAAGAFVGGKELIMFVLSMSVAADYVEGRNDFK